MIEVFQKSVGKDKEPYYRADMDILAYVLANIKVDTNSPKQVDYTNWVELSSNRFKPLDFLGYTEKDFKINEPTVEHLKLANDIRKYYSQRFTMDTLHGRKLSKWRTTLAGILKRDELLEIPEDENRILTKLPEFYYYDQAIENIIDTHEPVTKYKRGEGVEVKGWPITRVKHLIRKTSKSYHNEYWFTGPKGEALRYTLRKGNELTFLFDKVVSEGRTIKLIGFVSAAEFAVDKSKRFYSINNILDIVL